MPTERQLHVSSSRARDATSERWSPPTTWRAGRRAIGRRVGAAGLPQPACPPAEHRLRTFSRRRSQSALGGSAL